VSKQKLDLVQFATGKVAEPRAAAPEIMRREFFDAGTLRGGLDDFPQYLDVMPVPQTRPVLLMDRKSVHGCAQLCPGGRR
jgi:hypothetical protein